MTIAGFQNNQLFTSFWIRLWGIDAGRASELSPPVNDSGDAVADLS